MPEVLSYFAQYGLPGAVTGAMFVWVWAKERSHAKEIEALQAHIREIHKAHKDDLKDANKTLIAAHADIHEVVDKMGKWAEVMLIVDEQQRGGSHPPHGPPHGLPPRRGSGPGR